MCFSVNVNLVKEEIEDRYGVIFPDKYRYEPSYYYHAFGLPELPAICSDNTGEAHLLRWGLIPSWIRTKDDADKIKFRTFNARAESISSKPSFSLSFKSKHCIIPVKGFFEWQHMGSEKIPWYIYSPENEIFTLAGLYSDWTDPEDGIINRTFSIITTDANDLMAEIHNSKKRMPVVLRAEDEKKWLDLSLPEDVTLEMLKPCPSDSLKAHTVSPLINDRNASKNTPEIIKEYYRDTDQKLF